MHAIFNGKFISITKNIFIMKTKILSAFVMLAFMLIGSGAMAQTTMNDHSMNTDQKK